MDQKKSGAASERARQRRESILAAAREVFQRYGYRKATIEDIATAAAITRPTLYEYFKGKKELLTALIEWEASMALQTDVPWSAEQGGCREKLRALFFAINDYIGKNPFLKGITRRDPDIVTPEVIRIAYRFERLTTEAVATVLKEGMKDGTVYATDPDLLAYSIVRLHEAFFLSGFLDGSRYTPERIIRFFEELMDQTLPPRPGRRASGRGRKDARS